MEEGSSGLTFLAGQPGVLVLDQLEQRGLHLFDLGDLGEHELAVLASFYRRCADRGFAVYAEF